jgi:hypothetical protein
MRLLVILAAAVVSIFVVGCGNTSSAKPTGINCGPAYTFVARTAHPAGTCSGSIGGALHTTLRRGEHFIIRQSAETGEKLDFPTLAPSNRAVKLLSQRGPIARYVAANDGQAKLIARHTKYCQRRLAAYDDGCVAYIVTVR